MVVTLVNNLSCGECLEIQYVIAKEMGLCHPAKAGLYPCKGEVDSRLRWND